MTREEQVQGLEAALLASWRGTGGVQTSLGDVKTARAVCGNRESDDVRVLARYNCII